MIKKININKIKTNPDNPRLIKDDKYKKLIQSIRDFPQMLNIRPIVINADMMVLGGNMRLKACQEAGIKQIPVICADDLTPEQQQEFIIKDNIGFGEWDWDMIANSFDTDQLIEWGMDLPDFPNTQDAQEDDFETPDTVTTDIVRGDIIEIGSHRLMCGDSTNTDDVDKLMDGQQADMVFCDPPYGMKLDADFSDMKSKMGKSKSGNKYDNVIGDHDDFTPELIHTIFACFNDVPEIFIWGADYFSELLPNKNDGSWIVWDKRTESQSDGFGSEFELCWSKNKHKRRMLRHDWFGFLSSGNGHDARNRVHPTQKPVTLISDVINKWGNNNDLVVDIYAGSGSTMVACEQLTRQCYGMELDEKYCQVIIDRMLKLNPKLTVKINGSNYKHNAKERTTAKKTDRETETCGE